MARIQTSSVAKKTTELLEGKPTPKKRGRPKKLIEQPLPPKFTDTYEKKLVASLFNDELQKKLNGVEEEESPYYDAEKPTHSKRKGEWDVLLEDEIKYFDPTLSYELTGYRPLTMIDSLDFDPSVFTEPSDTYERLKQYTAYKSGTKPFMDYWNEQRKRCVEGYTVGKYRITGDHYFFLNFYRMQTVVVDAVKKTKGRKQTFPSFSAMQYEFFHYVELCEHLGKDIAMLKARGIGFSEILASLGVRPFITTREFKSIYTAHAKEQLEKVLSKCWTQLDWLALNTNGGFKRLRQKIDNIMEKKASMIDPEGMEYGSMSYISGIVADQPKKVRGDRAERLFFEEAGSNPCLVTSWVQGEALIDLGGLRIGSRFAGGTGGDRGSLDGLATIFNNPLKYDVLPYKHAYTRDGKTAFTGFFVPSYKFALDPQFIDHRGVTNEEEFKKHYEQKRSELDGEDLVTYCAERCFTPDEALLLQGENMFDATLLADRLTQIRVHKMYEKPQPMALLWERAPEDQQSREKVKAEPHIRGDILVVEPPRLDDDGTPYKNLYVIGIDAIDQGVKDSATSRDVSDYCIIVYRRQFGLDSPKIVAMYKKRPNDIREAFETALKLAIWYNAKVLIEYTKISTVTHFTEAGKRNYFMSRPKFAMSGNTGRSGKQLIGVQASEAVIMHGLELISGWIMDNVYGCDYDEILEQLLHYSYANKRKFDCVAALSMALIADEELMNITPRKVDQHQKEFRDIGYYYDDQGYKRYGPIPKKNENWAGLRGPANIIYQ